jgi:hypothetical protein
LAAGAASSVFGVEVPVVCDFEGIRMRAPSLLPNVSGCGLPTHSNHKRAAE